MKFLSIRGDLEIHVKHSAISAVSNAYGLHSAYRGLCIATLSRMRLAF